MVAVYATVTDGSVLLYKTAVNNVGRRLVNFAVKSENPPFLFWSRFLEIYYCSTAMIKKPLPAPGRWQWIF
jgi:hypothetical protein